MSKLICGLCDGHYDDSDAEAVAVHAHPEPQSGEYREHWINSKLPYDRWLTETQPGREWQEITATT